MTKITYEVRGLVSVRAMPGLWVDVPRAVMDAWTERALLKGNAKARRRWRRRGIPNSQMLKALEGRARESVSDVREVLR